MKKPRMPNKQQESVYNEASGERDENDDTQDQSALKWSVETVVVNGQPMTVTFPLEES